MNENQTVNSEEVTKEGAVEAMRHKAATELAEYMKRNTLELGEEEKKTIVERTLSHIDYSYLSDALEESARPKLTNWKTWRQMTAQAVVNVAVGVSVAGIALFVTKKVSDRKAAAGAPRMSADPFSNTEAFRASERPNKSAVKAV